GQITNPAMAVCSWLETFRFLQRVTRYIQRSPPLHLDSGNPLHRERKHGAARLRDPAYSEYLSRSRPATVEHGNPDVTFGRRILLLLLGGLEVLNAGTLRERSQALALLCHAKDNPRSQQLAHQAAAMLARVASREDE